MKQTDNLFSNQHFFSKFFSILRERTGVLRNLGVILTFTATESFCHSEEK